MGIKITLNIPKITIIKYAIQNIKILSVRINRRITKIILK